MISKYYEKVKQFIKENYLGLLFYLVLVSTLLYPMPYYISTGGGCIDTNTRVIVRDAYPAKGSFHLAYVSQLRATLPTFLLAHIIPGWEIESIEEYQISSLETPEELQIRDRLYLESANTAAIFNAYQKAGKRIQVNQQKVHVMYIENRTTTDLKIGDIIKSFDGKKIENLDEMREIAQEHEIGDTIPIEVEHNHKSYSRSAEVYQSNGRKMIGVSVVTTYEYELDPTLELKFKKSEAGPSGGLMLSLTIYNDLTREDLTRGRKIVGTGTIDMDGNVGSIGGVPYKLQGAVESHADIFLVPMGKNYEDALKEKEEKGYTIEIIGVETMEDAISKLEKN